MAGYSDHRPSGAAVGTMGVRIHERVHGLVQRVSWGQELRMEANSRAEGG